MWEAPLPRTSLIDVELSIGDKRVVFDRPAEDDFPLINVRGCCELKEPCKVRPKYADLYITSAVPFKMMKSSKSFAEEIEFASKAWRVYHFWDDGGLPLVNARGCC